jgi:hypothetical protein
MIGRLLAAPAACLLALTFVVVAESGAARVRCSADPLVAAEFIVPPPPFKARGIVVRRWRLPPQEPPGRGPRYKRLYLVTFFVVKGNAVLPRGHRYSQFAYVARKTVTAPWCFLKGGSGP